jgi:HlyD family secretion protein
MLMRWTFALFVIAVSAGCGEAPPANEIRATGHVEATDVRLAPEVGGRIVLLNVEEGDRVEPGAVILKLDARDAELAIDRAKAERSHAEAQLKLLQAGSRREDINQAQAEAQAARGELAAARAELSAAETDLQRFEALLNANAGSRKQRDDAALRRDVARERVEAAENGVRAAEQAVARLRAGARREEIEAARARLDAAVAQVASVEETLNDTTLQSPIGGVVTEKLAEVGEVIAPRSPVIVITDLVHAWADVFVPEPVVPRIRLGQRATVFTDAGGSGIAGTVSYISPKAEFTPRNVQTAEERSKLVYRVRVNVDNKDGVLKQGMPVEAVIPLQAVP